jgi:hypothetical protein
LRNYQDFDVLVTFMQEKGLLTVNELGRLIVPEGDGETSLTFLASLIWPFVDTYWMVVVFMFTMLPDNYVGEDIIYNKVQWFCENMHEERLIAHYESCSKDTI